MRQTGRCAPILKEEFVSRGVRAQVSTVFLLSIVCLPLVSAILLLSGCSTSSVSTTHTSAGLSSGPSPQDHSPPTTVDVMTTSPWAYSWPSPEASEAARSAISDWPSGIARVVLSTGYELYVVDHDGIRWGQEMQTRPETTATLVSPALLSGVAVSNNQEFVAYVDQARDIVVRSIADGAEISRVPYHAEGETQLRSLSSDGNLVALASVPPDLPEGALGTRLPWRVTIMDMRSGEMTIEQPLEDLAKERTADDPETQFRLYSLDWLPGERLLAGYSGSGQTVYVYDIHTDVLEPLPDVGLISAVSDSGTVYGLSADAQSSSPVVWDGLATQTLELNPGSAYALWGAFDPSGDALAIQVMSSTHQPLGWQLFRLKEGRWEPSGMLAGNSWMKAAPRTLSDDGTLAFTALEGGLQWENGQNAALLSYDFQTGTWQEWLGPEDLLVHFGQYPFVAIIPAS